MAKKFDITQAQMIIPEEINPITGISESPKKSILDQAHFIGTASQVPEIGIYGDTGVGKSKYDENILPSEISDLGSIRAANQPIGAKAFNAVVGGVASGVLTAAQDVGYLFDVENNIDRMLGLDNVSENWFGQLMRDAKEGLGEAMPIYRESNEVFDWDDPGFYFSAIKGIIDSAVGFGLPGLGATKAIGAASKAAKLTQLFKMSEPTAKVANSIASGFLTNFMEGKTMAVEQFENSISAMTQNLTNTNFEKLRKLNPDLPGDQLYNLAVEQTNQELASGKQKDFEKIAGEEANKFMLRNKAFILTDAIGLHGLYKGEGFTRGLLKDKSMKSWAKSFGKLNEENMILQGGKEYIEEVSQNVMQKEGEYQSAKRTGADVSDTPENLTQRVLEFAMSDQAQLEGLMGFLGGGPQRIMMEVMSGNFGAKAKEQYKKQYDAQQKTIEDTTNFLNTKLSEFSKAQGIRNDLIKSGKGDLNEFMKSTMFLNIVGQNFVNKTTENLERQLKDIANGVSEDERLAHGWDENYKEQARAQLTELKRLETEFLKNTKYVNQLETFTNRENRRIAITDQQYLKNEIELINDELKEQDVPDQARVEERKALEFQLGQMTNHIAELDKKFKEITSAKHQRQLIKDKKEFDKGVEEASEKLADLLAKKQADNKKKKRVDNSEVKDSTLKDLKKEEEAEAKQAKDIDKENVDVNKVAGKEEDSDIDAISALVERGEVSVDKLNKDIDSEDGVDINKLNDIDDESEDGVDIDAVTGDEVSPEVKMAEKQFAEEGKNLLNDLIKMAERKKSKENEPSNAPSQEEITEEMMVLGRLQKMVQHVKTMTGKEEVTFDDVIVNLLKSVPEAKKSLAPIFKRLEGLYLQINDNFRVVETLDEYLKLTPDERNELEAAKNISNTVARDQYTEVLQEKIIPSMDIIENALGARNNNKEGEATYKYRRVEFAGNIIAYLSRKYVQVKKYLTYSKEDTDNS